MADLLKAMSNALMTSELTLSYLMRSAPYRYKVYPIRKKRGGERIIAQPAKEVKTLQYWIMEHVLRQYPIHPAAMAYRDGRNIRTNALAHVGGRFLLKLDFKDFFHSIGGADFAQFLAVNSPERFTTEEVMLLSRALFWDRGRQGKLVLSIGAPASPMLSNILMHDFDKAVRAYCAPRRVRYTRYADDLTFSTRRPNILWKVEQQVSEICRELRFPALALNHEKTVYASNAGARRVTGLVLSNDGAVSLGRDKKRALRAEVHHFIQGRLDEQKTTSLRGKLAFVRSVEPGFIAKLAARYGRKRLGPILD
jgi:RNA-directed DNA polymerase